MKRKIIATRVGYYVHNSVKDLTGGLGISVSEYLRKLIIQDLDMRHLFEDELAQAVESSKASESNTLESHESSITTQEVET